MRIARYLLVLVMTAAAVAPPVAARPDKKPKIDWPHYLTSDQRQKPYERVRRGSRNSGSGGEVSAEWLTAEVAYCLVSAAIDFDDLGGLSPDDAYAALRSDDAYVVIVRLDSYGRDARTGAGSRPLKPRGALMQVGKSNERAIGVVVRPPFEIARSKSGPSWLAYCVAFPRKRSNGEDWITSLDDSVQIIVEGWGGDSAMRYKPKEMVTSLADL